LRVLGDESETQCAAVHLLRNKSTAWLARASMGRTWDQQRMIDLFNSFISKTFLRSVWALEYENFMGSAGERALAERLVTWAIRKDLRETSAEPAFIQKANVFPTRGGRARGMRAGARELAFVDDQILVTDRPAFEPAFQDFARSRAQRR
jgi:hypothetical protein